MVKNYGLIGYPLGHSYSAEYFNEKFRSMDLDSKYSLYPLEKISDLPELLKRDETLMGLNVTAPYKEAVLPYLDELSPEAMEIEAINVIKITRDGGHIYLKGFNSDASGFYGSIANTIGNIRKSLVLGSGGASRAVAYALRKNDIEVSIVSRSNRNGNISYEELTPEIINATPLIVNATPLGTYPEVDLCPDIPYDAISPDHFCVDLVYNPAVTEFMRRCSERGATIKNGLSMLFHQAEKAWKIWNDN